MIQQTLPTRDYYYSCVCRIRRTQSISCHSIGKLFNKTRAETGAQSIQTVSHQHLPTGYRYRPNHKMVAHCWPNVTKLRLILPSPPGRDQMEPSQWWNKQTSIHHHSWVTIYYKEWLLSHMCGFVILSHIFVSYASHCVATCMKETHAGIPTRCGSFIMTSVVQAIFGWSNECICHDDEVVLDKGFI